MNGLLFTGTVLKAFGYVIVLGGGVTALLGAGEPIEGDGFRRRLVKTWNAFAQSSRNNVSASQTRWLLSLITTFIRTYFVEADKTAPFNALFIGLVFILIPVAALINYLVGGSPFLILLILSGGALLAILNFTGEVKKLSMLNGLAALYLVFFLPAFIPAYVFYSFTDRILTEVIGHAAIESIPAAALCYIAAYSGMQFIDIMAARSFKTAVTAAHCFLAALPVAYALTFVALLTGHFAVAQDPHIGWRLLISAMIFSSLSLPLTVAAFSRFRLPAALSVALPTAAILSTALLYFGYFNGSGRMTIYQTVNVLIGNRQTGSQIYLGPDFWLMHLPFIPLLFIAAGIAFGGLAKAVLAASRAAFGADVIAAKPYQLSGMLIIVCGALLCGLGFAF
ncbi:MAG: hypothetical protein A3G18_13290 [Rhodospirillales bacterium RIFCSPLOWO2_12_FULL_58_28]|nr:MAG: hypothetical protein A3H92_13145 [Rhodospirillales bacterium RIFCSPLOWO2_02_FULL_58_16]OHC78552.1 MAG: hypothetical protein A3G18_13290 [Rhodospirillales bacterium RIFCSPLOWO2_12_FULL_58_28]